MALTTATTTQADLNFSPVMITKEDVSMKKDTRMADLIFGSVAGMTGKVVEYPFDTVKVRLQCQPLTGELKGPMECIRQGFREEGLRGFYKVKSVKRKKYYFNYFKIYF